MAKKITKSEHIRRFLANKPDAAPKAIVEALAKKKIEVTQFLASKIKYDKANHRMQRAETAGEIHDFEHAEGTEKGAGELSSRRALKSLSRSNEKS